jgi:hypothetical protein
MKMKITLKQLRALIRESFEGSSRPASDEEMEYFNRLRSINRSRGPQPSVDTRLDYLEAKMDEILLKLGDL